jgi:hypothetical protein
MYLYSFYKNLILKIFSKIQFNFYFNKINKIVPLEAMIGS